MSDDSKINPAVPYQHDVMQRSVDESSRAFLREEFLKPPYLSFADFLARAQENNPSRSSRDWIQKPVSLDNILDFVNSDEFKSEEKYTWIKLPNANSDEELERAVNDGVRYRSNVTGSVGGTVVERGKMMFIQANTNFQIRLEGRYRYWNPNWSFIPYHDGGSVYGIDVTTPLVKKGPITIVTISPGEVGIALLDNEPVLLLPGRHAYNNPLFIFSQQHVYNVNLSKIHLHTITILNIRENQIGFANLDNKYLVLLPGLHVVNNPSYTHVATLRVHGPHFLSLGTVISGTVDSPGESSFKIGTLTVARVRPNEYGCAYVDNAPKLLYPGFYVENSASFSFRRVRLSNAQHISFGPLHVLNVPKGQIALVHDQNKPLLIDGPTVVMKNSTLFSYVNMYPATEPIIHHGSITRYRIPTGNIGFARRKGIVEKLSPGVRVVDDPDFFFIRHVPAHTEIIQEGHYSLITTREGGVRPVWNMGVLEILKEGFKEYESPNLVVGGMIALSPPIIEFKEIEAYTRDRSQMLISGQVEYEVQNPKQLVTTISAEKLVESLEKRVDAILRHQLAITDLSSISPEPERPHDKELEELRKGLKIRESHKGPTGHTMFQPNKQDSRKSRGGEEESSDYTNQLSMEATRELSADAERWGVKVIKVEVSDIHYKDRKVEESISERTTQTRIAESDYDFTLVKNRQEIVEAEAQAHREYILAESETKKALLLQRTNQTSEDIENEIQFAKKKSIVEAEAIEINGKAEADAQKVLEAAKAEARAIEIRAEAKLLATKKEAEGKAKLLEVEHKRYGGAKALLELELMALEVQMAEAAAHAKVPTVSMNTSQASEGSLLAMLRNQGTGLFRLASAASEEAARREEREQKSSR